eukprot:gene35093-12344_t
MLPKAALDILAARVATVEVDIGGRRVAAVGIFLSGGTMPAPQLSADSPHTVRAREELRSRVMVGVLFAAYWLASLVAWLYDRAVDHRHALLEQHEDEFDAVTYSGDSE